MTRKISAAGCLIQLALVPPMLLFLAIGGYFLIRYLYHDPLLDDRFSSPISTQEMTELDTLIRNIYDRYGVRIVARELTIAYSPAEARHMAASYARSFIQRPLLRDSQLNVPLVVVMLYHDRTHNSDTGWRITVAGTPNVYCLDSLAGLVPEVLQQNGIVATVSPETVVKELDRRFAASLAAHTWRGRWLPREAVVIFEIMWYLGFFGWNLMFFARALDGRQKALCALPVEIGLGLGLSCAALICAGFIAGWPEVDGFVVQHIGLSGWLLGLPAYVLLSRPFFRRGMIAMYAVAVVACALTVALPMLPVEDALSPERIGQQVLRQALGSVAVWGAPLLALRFIAFRLGDSSRGALGSIALGGRLFDVLLCQWAGKPQPVGQSDPQTIQSKIWLGVLETSLVSPVWWSILLFSLLGDRLIQARAKARPNSILWTWLESFEGRRLDRLEELHLKPGRDHLDRGAPRDAIMYAEQGLAILESYGSLRHRFGHAEKALELYSLLGTALALCGEPEKAREALECAVDVSRELNFERSITPMLRLGRILYAYGDYANAEGTLAEAALILDQMESRWLLPGRVLDSALFIRQFIRVQIEPALRSYCPAAISEAAMIEIHTALDTYRVEIQYTRALCLTALSVQAEQSDDVQRLRERAQILREHALIAPPEVRENSSPLLNATETAVSPLLSMIMGALLLFGDRKELRHALEKRVPGTHWMSDDAVVIIRKNPFHPARMLLFDVLQSKMNPASPLQSQSIESGEEEQSVWSEITAHLGWYPHNFLTPSARQTAIEWVKSNGKSARSDETHPMLWTLWWQDPLDEAVVRQVFDIFSMSGEPVLEPIHEMELGQMPEPTRTLAWLARTQIHAPLVTTYSWLAANEARLILEDEPIRAKSLFLFALGNYALLGYFQGFIEAVIGLAEIALRTELFYSAWRLAQLASSLSADLELTECARIALCQQGRALRGLGELGPATEMLECALLQYEEVRGRIIHPEGRVNYQYAGKDLSTEYALTLLQAGRTADALDAVERGKSRTMLDLLGSHQISVSNMAEQELIIRETEVREALHTCLSQVNQEQSFLRERQRPETSASDVGESLIDELRRRINDLRAESVLVKQKIRECRTEWASLRVVKPVPFRAADQPVDLEQMLQTMAQNSNEVIAAIDYLVTDNETIIFLIINNNVQKSKLYVARTGLTQAMIVGWIDAMVGTEPSENQPSPALEKLYRFLIEPVNDLLRTHGVTLLVISPHKALHLIPWSALWHSTGDGARFLSDDYAYTLLPSLSTLEFLEPKRRKWDGTGLIVGNPDPPGNLPFAEQEAQWIADALGVTALIRANATCSAVIAQGSTAGLMHFACHGEYNQNEPLRSHLILADGLLRVDAIMDLKIQAGLVTLSACESGRNKIRDGDDLIGMTRSWMYAGAPAVLAALWKVDDSATAEILTVFYQYWRSGMPKARAFQRALRYARDDEELGYKSPHLWAGFNLIGDPF